MRTLAVALFGLAVHLTAGGAAAQVSELKYDGVRRETPSGLPVPRFVSLKNNKSYCRTGPSFDHPIAITYLRAGLPVQVVAETTDHWRKIKDHDGAECWMHKTTLRSVDHVLVTRQTVVRAKPNDEATPRAQFATGVLAELRRTSGDWRFIAVGDLKGWARRESLWGAQK